MKLLGLTCLAVNTFAIPYLQGQQISLRATNSAGEIHVDGRLDETAWMAADSISDLTQVEPAEGARPSGRTVVRVLVTSDAIVFGFRNEYASGTPVVAYARERDAILTNEDHVQLVLDTFRDGRSGYVFAVNANGARYDALVSNQGEGENANWDAVWEARTARTPNGWSAEIRIPLKSILFRRGLTEWGFNVQRRLQRAQETDRWASPDRDVKINQTSRAGLLVAIPSFDLGVGLSVRPSITASAGQPSPGARMRNEQDVSLDVTQRLGANTLGSLTVNTDFGETEVDTRRTNLTRFPLVFPEKRTFFLEGSDVFDFGLGTGDDVRPFFSRRIGLLGGREVPLDAGLKVNGREGGTSYGALVVRTDDVDTLATENTMGVLRVQRNVLRESSVGMIGSFGDPVGRPNSWLAGADLTFQTTRFRGGKNFLVGAWGLATDRDDLTGQRHAIGAKVDYPNDLWDIALTYKWLGDGFDPSLGFVPRRGVQILNFNVNYQPRPTRPILGLYEFWVENRVMLELVTQDMIPAYVKIANGAAQRALLAVT